jgi:hypothetical protein
MKYVHLSAITLGIFISVVRRKLRDIWVKQVANRHVGSEAVSIRVLHPLSKMTLDLIGEAGQLTTP